MGPNQSLFTEDYTRLRLPWIRDRALDNWLVTSDAVKLRAYF